MKSSTPRAHSRSNATRLLSAGVYLEKVFRKGVIEELVTNQYRVVAPAYGYDVVTVLAHALAARRIQRVQIAAAVVGGAVLVFLTSQDVIGPTLTVLLYAVLLWATIPTLLYYLGIVFAVEADARRFGAHSVDIATPKAWTLLLRGGYHFASLGIIIVFLALDIPPFAAVVYASGVAALFSLASKLFGDGTVRQWLKELVDALAEGIRGALPVVAVCAAAGVITSTITKTGLGQELADALVKAANALSSNPTVVLALTVVFSAVAVCVLGLAVPVTASFIISWVVIGPALIALGAAKAEVHAAAAAARSCPANHAK
ncbi:TRAP transporter large permease subunit [Kibdelosporangium lantanae]|uniref:TRAP transporter large permease subunit n=1 Tax=Kibdelosporangium lantanae TaxID=1497396 RepID=A0ABW3M718_9PSEU